MTDTATYYRDANRARVPHTVHLKVLKMVDGREIVIDRRTLGFLCPIKGHEETQTIVGFRITGAKPVPVAAAYTELKACWFADAREGQRQ